MSDISIPGVSSKYNTTKLVDDLVAAERIRLTQMEDEVSQLEESRSIWRDVSRDIGSLQRSVKTLYGFENPFVEKTAVSSDESVLTASASRNAPFDNYSIVVKQVASADRFLSKSLERSFRVEAGRYTFSVGEQKLTLRYRGGSAADFARRLTEKGEGLVRASTVRDTPNTQVLMIEAVPTGSANRMGFEDDARDLALKSGMMRRERTASGAVTPRNVAASPADADGGDLPEDAAVISEESILVRPQSSLRIPLDDAVTIEDGMVLEYSYRTVEHKDVDLTPPPPPGPLWPEVPRGSYKGLTVRSAPNDMVLPPEERQPPPPRRDVREVLSAQGSSESAALPPVSPSSEYRRVQVPSEALPGDLRALLLDNGNTHRSLEIRGIRVFDPNRRDDLEPARAVSRAGDAVIEFRGIEARRPDNTIDDLVDGLTITLKKAYSESVDINVESDTEAAKEGIIRFVFSYNQLLTRILVLTGSSGGDITDDTTVLDQLEYLEDDEREDLEGQFGRLRADASLNRLKSRLRTISADSYSTRAGDNLTMLAQIGVSTDASSGSSGDPLDFFKLRGYLEIDEDKLDAALSGNIEAVKDLFGRDTTGDYVIDSGAARSVDEYLTAYTRTGGFIKTRLAGIDGQIEDKNDDIADYEEYLADYEAGLKRQYGNMEAILNQLENSSRDLDNFTRQQSGNR